MNLAWVGICSRVYENGMLICNFFRISRKILKLLSSFGFCHFLGYGSFISNFGNEGLIPENTKRRSFPLTWEALGHRCDRP